MTILAWVALVFSGFVLICSLAGVFQLNVFLGTFVLAICAVPPFFCVSYLFLNLPDNVNFGFAIGVAVYSLLTLLKTVAGGDERSTKIASFVLILPQIALSALYILTYVGVI